MVENGDLPNDGARVYYWHATEQFYRVNYLGDEEWRYEIYEQPTVSIEGREPHRTMKRNYFNTKGEWEPVAPYALRDPASALENACCMVVGPGEPWWPLPERYRVDFEWGKRHYTTGSE